MTINTKMALTGSSMLAVSLFEFWIVFGFAKVQSALIVLGGIAWGVAGTILLVAVAASYFDRKAGR